MREVALDDAGMRVDLLRKTDASIVYVMPSHQFPLGIVMPMKRQAGVVELGGGRTGAVYY